MRILGMVVWHGRVAWRVMDALTCTHEHWFMLAQRSLSQKLFHRMLRKVESLVTETSSLPHTRVAMSGGQNLSTACLTYWRTLKRLKMCDRQSSQDCPTNCTISSRSHSGTNSSPATHAPPELPIAYTPLHVADLVYPRLRPGLSQTHVNKHVTGTCMDIKRGCGDDVGSAEMRFKCALH